MSEDSSLKIDFGDGVSSLDRVMRSIIMVADQAIGKLLDLGWSRKTVNIEIDPDDPLPCWVTIRKKRVFEIRVDQQQDGVISVKGEWLEKAKRPGIIDRFWGV